MTPRQVKLLNLDFARSVQTQLPVEFRGVEFMLEARAYRSQSGGYEAMALINRHTEGPIAAAGVVRIHSGCVTGDIFHSQRCDCHSQLQAALARITTTANGVLIYLPYHEGRGIGLFNKIRAYAAQDHGLDTVDANIEIGAPIDARDYDLAAHILWDLRISQVRLMTNNPAKVDALRANGIEVIEQIPLIIAPSDHNERYLETKRKRLHHKL